jgi:hypothetical protein
VALSVRPRHESDGDASKFNQRDVFAEGFFHPVGSAEVALPHSEVVLLGLIIRPAQVGDQRLVSRTSVAHPPQVSSDFAGAAFLSGPESGRDGYLRDSAHSGYAHDHLPADQRDQLAEQLLEGHGVSLSSLSEPVTRRSLFPPIC